MSLGKDHPDMTERLVSGQQFLAAATPLFPWGLTSSIFCRPGLAVVSTTRGNPATATIISPMPILPKGVWKPRPEFFCGTGHSIRRRPCAVFPHGVCGIRWKTRRLPLRRPLTPAGRHSTLKVS